MNILQTLYRGRLLEGPLLRQQVAYPWQRCLRVLLCMWVVMVRATAASADEFGGDPLRSMQWPVMRQEFLAGEPVQFDARVQVLAPAFAEDPMNVPVTVVVGGLQNIERLVVLVDRNPIRKVLEFTPLRALPAISFRFKLEQASPVRAAARTADGTWHVGNAWVDSAGGGCTVAGATRRDGSWASTLGEVSGRLFAESAGTPDEGGAFMRLRLRIMHPMDTGLVSGIPAFYLNQLTLQDAQGQAIARLRTFEPISENPVFSFDLPGTAKAGMRLVGSDNNGNRIDAKID